MGGGAVYMIAGRKIGSEYVRIDIIGNGILAIATLSTIGLGAYAAVKRAQSKKPNPLVDSPPINASSVEEEAFIQEFLKSAEADENKKDH
ncbi:10668_t:CDS:2 [Scutellospora calospora]|uniref:10668_t:CDS:1 n=1 Tax=Scutellospora calospora TaxID=85575 RepID=A0ACA9KTD5_9GLOM|nr:10668_t:CDS:2 [Scutellospora calospora]